MRFSTSDFPLMRRSVLAVCASTLVSAVILYGSGEYSKSAQNNLSNAKTMLNDARNRLATALQDQENMAIYAGEYGVLTEQKIIGDDQRLDWIEGLEKIRLKNLVAGFRYHIAPQKNYASQPPIDSGNFDVRYSEMKLQFDLLHEAQLLNFFEALRADIKGWYQLEGCTIQRTGADNEDEQSAATLLKAECSGGWITLENRNTPK